MSMLPKPRPIAFMAAGYDLADALAILEKWDSMDDSQIAALGLLADRPGNRHDCTDELNVLRPVFGKTRRDLA